MFIALRSMFRDREGKVILVWALGQLVIGTLAYHWIEHWSFVDSLYFSVVTLSTVGYGDLHPTTTFSKLFTVVYIAFGLGVIAAFISELTKHRSSVISRITSRSTSHDGENDDTESSGGPVTEDPVDGSDDD